MNPYGHYDAQVLMFCNVLNGTSLKKANSFCQFQARDAIWHRTDLFTSKTIKLQGDLLKWGFRDIN